MYSRPVKLLQSSLGSYAHGEVRGDCQDYFDLMRVREERLAGLWDFLVLSAGCRNETIVVHHQTDGLLLELSNFLSVGCFSFVGEET
jgi:hypothetical protein